MADGFQPKFVDLVRNTTTTVGTGNFTLGAAATGFTSFIAALQLGDSFYYSALGVDKPAEHEVGRGTLLAGGAISRDPIGGVKTNFSSGTKTISLIAAAEWYSQVQAGSSASSRATLAALPHAQGAATLCEAGREGLFVWTGSDQSAAVATDPLQGIYVAPGIDATGASGAWVRKYSGPLSVKWFGVAGDGIADDSRAFINAIAFLRSSATTGYGYGNAGGAKLFIPKGVYFLGTTTLDIDFGLIIEGESVGLLGPGSTVLKWAAGTTGFRTQNVNTTGATGTKTPATNSGIATLRNLLLVGAYSSTEAEAHGVHLRETACLENISIYNFEGDGVYMHNSAGSGAPTEGNSNCSTFTRVLVQGCRNGFNIDLGDVNACSFIGCIAISNRQWGFWDSSFLGNSYFGCMTQTNGWIVGSIPTTVTYSGNRYFVKAGQEVGASTNPPSGTTADNTWWCYLSAGGANAPFNINTWLSGTTYRAGGPYLTDDTGNAGNIFAGCYAEGDQPASQMVQPSLVVGGSMSPVKGIATLVGRGSAIGTDGGLYAAGSLLVQGASHQIGPQLGTVTDQVFFYDCTNVFTILQGRAWAGGAPTNTASLGFYYGNGTVLDVNNPGWKHRFRINGAETVIVGGSGIDLQTGKVLSVNGTQVVTAQQAAIPSDQSGATNQATVNAILVALRNHGLIAA
jgi:hypothetical protein